MKYLKTLLTSISSAALLLAFPLVTFAAYTAGWTGTSTGTNFIFPTLINGIYQTVQANNFLATSTTAASNFPLLGVGSSTPFGNLGVVGTTTIKGNLLVTRTGEIPTYNDSNLSLLDIVDNVNSYTFAAIQNKNAGASASADFVWGNNRTTTATYYADAGVTSSNYADPIFTLFAPNDGYFFSTDGGLNLGTGTTTSAGIIKFFTGGYAVANEKARITQEGNFGIGSTSPYASLSVTNTGTDPSFVVEDSTSPDSTPFIIDASGNTSVGTTSNTYKLTVDSDTSGATFGISSKINSTGGTLLDISNYAGGSNNIRFIKRAFSGNGITAWTIGQDNANDSFSIGRGANYLQALASTSKYLSIGTSGLVGIGTTSPITKLTVEDSTGGTAGSQITLSRSDTAVAAGDEWGSLEFFGNDLSGGGVGVHAKIAGYTTDAATNFGNLGFFTGINAVAGMTQHMTLTAAGNVGIGTTTPQEKFVVHSGSTGAATIKTGVLINTNFTDVDSGNALSFGVNGRSIPMAQVVSRTAGSNGELAFYTTSNFTTTAPTEKMRVTSAGNVGIGTSTPWARLAIQGFVGSTTPLFEIASSTNSSFATSTVFKVGYNGIITMSTTTDALTSLLNLGVNPTTTNGTTTVHMGKMQFEGYNTDNAIICKFVVGTTEVIQLGPCKN